VSWRAAGRVVLGSAAVAFACLVYTWLMLPDVRPLATHNPRDTAFMRLRAAEARRDGRPLRVVQQWVPYDRISPRLTRAVRLTEDATFWQNDGLDYAEIRDALETDWSRFAFVRGASTITQQLAKNLYLSPSRNPLRKIEELFLTRRLEAELSKQRIFELYLNVIEWGDGIWGAEAAAETYFHVPAADLDDEQAALLAGALINPHLYNPAHPNARLLRRQQMILGKMGVAGRPAPSQDAPHLDELGSPVARVEVLDAHGAARARRVHELAEARRAEGDADVGRPLGGRREEQQVALAQVRERDFPPDLDLFGDRARDVDVVLLEDVAHEAAAIEARGGRLAAQPIARPLQ